MVKNLKVGEKFLCIEDVIMEGSGKKEYTKGEVYKCERPGCLTNDSGSYYHGWETQELFDKHFKVFMEGYEKPYDHINPDHYKKNSVEVIDMMVAIWGHEAVLTHCELTAFKYRMRLGGKPGQPIERDYEKALWYESKAAELKALLNGKGV